MTNEMIKERAKSLYPIIRDQLNENYNIDESLANAFKYLYLVIYRPKKYLHNFKNGTIEIDLDDVKEVFQENYNLVPYDFGLTPEETAIIERHNYECQCYLSDQ